MTEETTDKTERGSEFIDFEKDLNEQKEAIESRFGRVYGNMKQNERVIEEQGAVMSKMHERIGQLEANQTNSSVEKQVAAAKAALVKAKEDGDIAKEVEIQSELTKLHAQPEPKPVPEIERPTTDSEFSMADQSRVQAWANEADEHGNLKRPWMQPNSPEFQKVVTYGNYQLVETGDVDAMCAAIDKKFGPKQARGETTVLDSGEKGSAETKSVNLTKDQAAVAKAMGIEPKEYAKYIPGAE